MTTEKENTTIFQSPLLAKKEINGISFKLYSNRIFYAHISDYEKIEKKIIEAGYQFLDENGGGKFYNIYHFDAFTDVDKETREWAADPAGNKYTHSDAIVIQNLGQKIIADFYLKINRPPRPTKIFYSLAKAMAWTESQMKKSQPD
ncbi:MAG: hypothetical protein JKY09_09410 [Crocinitomicaceae bacterium]|nr:hypothetical protein [Crocinitomicaceae bacterium]